VPDLRDVFDTATKHIRSDVDAWMDLERRRRGAMRKRKLGAIAVAAALCIGVIVLAFTYRSPPHVPAPVEEPSPVDPSNAAARRIATNFAEAVGRFDADRAATYLADDAAIPENLSVRDLPLLISLYEAMGYEQMLDPFEVTGTSGFGTKVRCPFDFHMIRSGEIGRGPYHGSHWDMTIADGAITAATQYWGIERFSGEVWEPFLAWVSAAHPDDVDVMYTGGATNFRVSDESVRVWERNSKQYVREVRRGNAE
jgi:hypothetical protein